MTVRFTPSRRQLTRAIRAINGTIPRIRIMRRLSWAALFVTIALILARRLSFEAAVALLFIPGLTLFILWMMPGHMARLSWSNSPVWRSEHVFTFSPAGIDVSTGTTGAHTAWPAIVRTAETPEFFLFFSSEQAGRFVPKQGISLLDVETIRDMFATYAGKAGATEPATPSADIVGDAVVQVSFEHDPREVARAGMATARKSGTLWMPYAAMVLIVGWNTVPMVYRQWKRGGIESVSIPLLLLGLFPLFLILIGPPLAARWAARREIRTGPSSRGMQRVGVADWGLQIAGPSYSGTLQWDAFMKVSETPEFFLFFLTKLQPVYIPKRVLSVADSERIRTLTRVGMGPKAELLDA